MKDPVTPGAPATSVDGDKPLVPPRRPASDTESVLNELLRRLLEDREAGRQRSRREYSALFPGHGELIER